MESLIEIGPVVHDGSYEQRMKRFLKTLAVVILLAAVAGGVGAWRWNERKEQRSLFRTAEVKRGDIAATISATGTIEPEEVVDVGAQVAGMVNSFGKDKSGKTIDYGSSIEEGTILAQIDDSVYAADVALCRAQLQQDKAGEARAAADLDQMKAKAVQAEADWKRAQDLNASKASSRSDYDSAKANFEVAKANVALGLAAIEQAKSATVKSEATLNKAQRNLNFCTIKSPVKGVIIDRRVNIGQTVVASLNAPSLFLIAKDLTRMQIWAAVNEADVGRIVPGAPVTFTCDAFPGREFEGAVGKVRLNATMTQNVVMYTVEVNADNPKGILLPYLTANVRFSVSKETGVLLVPNAGLRWNPSSEAQVSPEARPWSPSEGKPSAAGEAKSPKAKGEARERRGTIWLRDGEFVRPLEVKLGVSDGSLTAATAEGLAEGQEVVTGEEAQSSAGGIKNPFLPQVLRR